MLKTDLIRKLINQIKLLKHVKLKIQKVCI